MATAVAVPVVVALLVLIRVLGPGDDDAAADVTGATPTQRDDSTVEVQTPPITPEADAACPALMSQLPLELAGDDSRRVASDSPYAYAWGDPATTLVCGVDQPDYPADALLFTINGITWFVDTDDPTVNVWTTADRTVAVQLRIPSSTDGAAGTALSPLIASAIPAR
ncbi:Protein of unknown function [Klenkia soli]|uniref:DUF3515 domain-containing protein n=1 Tax=Klenkia soli TaxID=1052260 RepID=A0A1H0HZN5_9ACTN|nr:DUF3515 family protein [Klenkia soli]SDO24613.1 Protein of unknown function [Klenkia soli]